MAGPGDSAQWIEDATEASVCLVTPMGATDLSSLSGKTRGMAPDLRRPAETQVAVAKKGAWQPTAVGVDRSRSALSER